MSDADRRRTADEGWFGALDTAEYYWHAYTEARTLGAQSAAFESLSNAMSDLISWHPRYDTDTGRIERDEDEA